MRGATRGLKMCFTEHDLLILIRLFGSVSLVITEDMIDHRGFKPEKIQA